MSRQFLTMLALAGVVAPPAGVAQEPVMGEAAEPWELRLDRGSERIMQFVLNRRARLGLKVNLRARETDSIGAFVDAVSPNGPAAKAGIQSGDIIIRLNGQSVLAGGRAEGQGARAGESLPGLRLIELAARLEPNDTVSVEFRRGKERKSVSLVTADEPEVVFQGRPGERALAFRYSRPDGPRRMRMVDDFDTGFVRARAFMVGSPLSDVELAPLNPDLGRYFGTTEGVLVISVPEESQLSLKGGDVVLAVDGRKPATPSHLIRILRSYERGEGFKLDILRNGKREAVTGRLGEPGGR